MGTKPLDKMTEDELEAEAEWVLEANAEGYSWRDLAKRYSVTVRTLKKKLGIKQLSQRHGKH